MSDADFDWRAKITLAQVALLVPTLQHIERPERRGTMVHAFALPLQWCLGTNRTRHSRPGQHTALKRKILALLRVQLKAFVAPTLAGRPQVLCVRFSSVEPDAYSDWAKMAVDALCVPSGRRKDGLGLLRDDRPKDAEIRQWSEPAPKGDGFCYFEVRV